MRFQKQIVGALTAGLCLSMVSCMMGSGTVDARNPTVAEMDRLDVEWGLQPRKMKGAPKRTFQYQTDDTTGASASTAAAPPVEPTPQTAPSQPEPPTPKPPAEPQLDPSIINKLR